MTDEKSSSTSTATRSQLPLSEATLLALSSAAAYAVAFLFETGYADCFGYPHWLIDIGFSNVMLGWINIAVALLIFALLYFFIGLFISARWLFVVVFNRAFLLFFGSIMMIGAAFIPDPALPIWFAPIAFGFGSVMLVSITILWMYAYRKTDQALPAIERVRLANAELVPPVDASSTDSGAGSLVRKTISNPVIGPLYAWSLILLFPAGLVMLAANEYGQIRASSQSEFWISSDSSPLVALRRYGDKIIATPLKVGPSSSGASPIQVVPWESADRVWTMRYLSSRSRQRLSCR